MKKILLFIIILTAMTMTADAAKIDVYRQILLSYRYTIRYDNLTPAARITNKDKVELYGKSGLAVNNNDFFINRPLSGVITSDGDNRYEEVGYKDFYQCRLMKSGDNFIFTRFKSKKGNGFEYFGKRKGKVEANPRNYLAELISGESFGDPDFTKLLNAMLEDNEKSADMVKYKFVTAGELDNGLSFEDFSANDNGELSAIRYYFDGDKLTKIAFASYGFDKNGRTHGSKCIIKILEFTSTPDEHLLNLPAGVEDITRR